MRPESRRRREPLQSEIVSVTFEPDTGSQPMIVVNSIPPAATRESMWAFWSRGWVALPWLAIAVGGLAGYTGARHDNAPALWAVVEQWDSATMVPLDR